jgi:hypothetical protein
MCGATGVPAADSKIFNGTASERLTSRIRSGRRSSERRRMTSRNADLSGHNCGVFLP